MKILKRKTQITTDENDKEQKKLYGQAEPTHLHARPELELGRVYERKCAA